MKSIIFILFICSTSALCIEEELKRAIASRDTQLIQQLVARHKQETTTRGSTVQKIGREVLVRLYAAAEQAEKDAKKDTETYANRHVAVLIVQGGCCFTGASYHGFKLWQNWASYQNWTETLIGCGLAAKGFYDFYSALQNTDAQIEYERTQLITRCLKDLEEPQSQIGTVDVSDLEDTK